MKINLGCGTMRIPGFLGVDLHRGESVDVEADLTQTPWPFDSGTVDSIVAWHCLEHLPGLALDAAMREIHRILVPGGVVYIKVPFKERGPYNPFHFHVFDRRTFNAWLPQVAGGTGPDSCLQSGHGLFQRQRQEVVHLPLGFPLWHIRRRFPRLARIVFDRDERGEFSRRVPSLWNRGRELREWLVKPLPSPR